ncbi:tRNA (adenosine(37)-N6)-threonylcarbamoyltransferase complex dimerization subunit type 1 TsaB [Dinoroseobacter sp. S124A]|uniref:tRNA (adenosine(37)-N6)-threonylcarbamoyltransferase complex dimerization subunit type 1 TsaB n=1 Tax=Dinoroseobacter sp. S124A TaxID=3415128 RepID=UPI003C7D5D86
MTPLGPVLAFDTAAAHCAAALLWDTEIRVSRIEPMARGQAERLMPLLEEVLAETGIGWADLTALGVGIGPGNFTGIRISVAAARGLGLGLAVPVVGVSTLEALALGAEGPALVSLDARRGNAYLQGFGADGTALAPPVMAPVETAALPGTGPAPLCLGDLAPELATRSGGTVVPPRHPLPEAIARIAARRARPDLPPPAPLYLRPADAAPAKPAPALLTP